MAEMVLSAVVEETLKQALSGLIGSNGRQEDVVADVERLETAQIKLEAALDASRRWRIRDAPLLRWRRKLKRAAEECGGELRERRRRVAAEEDDDKASFPRRLARAFFGGGVRDADAAAAVRRFEWYADGAGEFLRFVELGGGSPRRHAPRVDPLIGRLLAGEELRYRRFVNRRGQYHQFCVRPVRLDGRGVEAKLIFVYEDDEAPEKNLCLGAILRLSESTDLVGTLVRCLELLLVTPHFLPAAESVRRELVALPRQDFSWVPPSYLDSGDNAHWNAMHNCLSQWFRPNPLCCNKQHADPTPTTSDTTTKLSDASDLEPVIGVFLQRHIPLAEYNAQYRSSKSTDGMTCLEKKKNVPHLRLGFHFSPHGSAESAAVELVDGEELQAAGGVHRNISLEELDEFVLPKAIDCLLHRRRPEAAAYQLFWKAKHGTAFLEVEKITGMVRRVGGSRRAARQWRRDPKLGMMWTQAVVDFFNLWVAWAPRRLQGSVVKWAQKANEMQRNSGLTSSY